MMDTQELSAALHAAADPVDAPPGFTERVRRGARRRVVRRRYRVCATVLAVLAVGGGLTALSAHLRPEVVSSNPTSKPPSDDPRLHGATRGDLAKDKTFLDQVRSVWQMHVDLPRMSESASSAASFDFSPHGPVNVYWAGNTPSGPAAVLLETYSWQSSAGGPQSTIVQIGVVATDSRTGVLSLAGRQTVGDPSLDQASDSFAFGENDTTVLTMVESGFGVYSATPTVDPNTGRVSRQWQDLPYADGVAVIDLREAANGEPVNGRTVVELPHRPDAAHQYPTPSGVTSRYQPELTDDWTESVDPRLTWPLTTGLNGAQYGTPGTDPAVWNAAFDHALQEGGYTDPLIAHPATTATNGVSPDSQSYWHISYRLGGGTVGIIGEELVGAIGRLYVVTVDGNFNVLSVAYGGSIDPAAVLPVRYRLPDGLGWALAAYGSHLSAGNLGGDGVLKASANASTVTVTPKGGVPHTVDLPP